MSDKLLAAAASEFASRGLQGARLEVIAEQAGITRAMIYYYFGGREGLYLATLEAAYRAVWDSEQAIDTQGLSPTDALRRLIEFRVDYYVRNPTFVALVQIENQQKAQFLKRAKPIVTSAGPALARTAEVLLQGQREGLFRRDIDVVDVYQVLVSIAFFNVSNRFTFGTIFGTDRNRRTGVERVRRFTTDVVLRYVLEKPVPTAEG